MMHQIPCTTCLTTPITMCLNILLPGPKNGRDCSHYATAAWAKGSLGISMQLHPRCQQRMLSLHLPLWLQRTNLSFRTIGTRTSRPGLQGTSGAGRKCLHGTPRSAVHDSCSVCMHKCKARTE